MRIEALASWRVACVHRDVTCACTRHGNFDVRFNINIAVTFCMHSSYSHMDVCLSTHVLPSAGEPSTVKVKSWTAGTCSRYTRSISTSVYVYSYVCMYVCICITNRTVNKADCGTPCMNCGARCTTVTTTPGAGFNVGGADCGLKSHRPPVTTRKTSAH
jgi:hypothetical protein